MNQSETIKEISKAFVSAQSEMGSASKSATNPHFKSKYATLEEVIDAVRKPLNNNGLYFVQAIGREDGALVVVTKIIHTSGEWLSASVPVVTSRPNDPQAMGSGITYAKRYGLQSLCGIPSEDDDGNLASQTDKRPPIAPVIAKAASRSPLESFNMAKQAIIECKTREALDKLQKRIPSLKDELLDIGQFDKVDMLDELLKSANQRL